MPIMNELLPNLKIYNKDKLSGYGNLKLSENFSPLTCQFFDLINKTLVKYNLILTYPESILRPAPLMAYLYSKQNGKTSLILTQNEKGIENESPKDIHSQNYHLLNSPNEYRPTNDEYLFYTMPMGIIEKNTIKSNIQLIRARPKDRKKIIEIEKEKFKSDSSKILLQTSNAMKKVDSIDKIVFTNEKDFITTDKNFDIGLVIFENVDRFIYSEYSAKSFIKWINTFMEQNVRFFFHFSNTESDWIDFLRNKTNSLIIPYNSLFLRKNSLLFENTNQYYSNIKKEISEILKDINLDSKSMFHITENMKILEPLLESGDIDANFFEAKSTLKDINFNKIKNKELFKLTRFLLYNLYDLVINPSKYKMKFFHGQNDKIYYNPEELINEYKNNLSIETSLNQKYLSHYFSNIKSIYDELSKCKRFGEEYSYDRIGKDYKFMEIGMNPEEYFEENNPIIFASFSNSEHNILTEQLNRFKDNESKYNLEIKSLSYLNNSAFDRSKYYLVLPGSVPPKFFSELLKPYKQILFLAYKGYNHDRIKDQINIIKEFSEDKIKESYTHIRILNKICSDDTFDPFIDEIEGEEKESAEKDEPDKVYIKPFKERINELIGTRYNNYKTDLENLKGSIDSEETDNNPNIEEIITFKLENISSGKIFKKPLLKNKSYLFLKSYGGKVEETLPINLKTDNIVVVLDNDNRKSLLDLIISTLDIGVDIDAEIVEYWKKMLSSYFESMNLTYTQLYDKYQKLGGEKTKQAMIHWVKGSVLGPGNAEDLRIIGEMIDNKNLKDNYNLFHLEISKIRNLHRSTGRKISKIIKSLIFEGENIDSSNFDHVEYSFYETVKNGIYRVVEKVN